ncbi:MAG TPA: hypothetical protein ENI44_03455, partial [Thermoplasmatales archaeon]|nr:hypothetical protein [Thermoplasmatales archaeon]
MAIEVCPNGPSKLGKQRYGDSEIPGYDPSNPDFDYGFRPEDIEDDLESICSDSSFQYSLVKQTLDISKKYGFDGICPDDTGRVIMDLGIADYADDIWTSILKPEKPDRGLYGLDGGLYGEILREKLSEYLGKNIDANAFALDSYANMIKHLRWQVKYVSSDNFLMSGYYFLPLDIKFEDENGDETFWKSIIASEDATVSDQFNIWHPSFARWAYNTFNLGYRVLRTDLRRTTDINLECGGDLELSSALKSRRDVTIGTLIATAWANKVHVDINDPRDCKIFSKSEDKWDDTDKLISNYIKMRSRTDKLWYEGEIGLPLFAEEESQKLLYHQKLNDPVVNIEGEYEFLGGNALKDTPTVDERNNFSPELFSEVDEPYTILYSLPSEFGEKGRILHV